MPATYIEATDQILALLNTGWLDGRASTLVGYQPVMYWPGDKSAETIDGSKFWARCSMQTVKDDQATLSTQVGSANGRRYTNIGLLVIQLFCPQSAAQAYSVGRQLAVLLRDIYRARATSGGVWFTEPKIRELPSEEVFYRFNILVTYRYDDVSIS